MEEAARQCARLTVALRTLVVGVCVCVCVCADNHEVLEAHGFSQHCCFIPTPSCPGEEER